MESLVKYYIVPKNSPIETVNAHSPDEALIVFASDFPVDLGRYFRAVTKSEYEEIESKRDIEGDRNVFIEFAMQVAVDDFDIPEEDAGSMAADAYQNYCYGHGGTEYDAVEEAADDYWGKENN